MFIKNFAEKEVIFKSFLTGPNSFRSYFSIIIPFISFCICFIKKGLKIFIHNFIEN